LLSFFNAPPQSTVFLMKNSVGKCRSLLKNSKSLLLRG